MPESPLPSPAKEPVSFTVDIVTKARTTRPADIELELIFVFDDSRSMKGKITKVVASIGEMLSKIDRNGISRINLNFLMLSSNSHLLQTFTRGSQDPQPVYLNPRERKVDFNISVSASGSSQKSPFNFPITNMRFQDFKAGDLSRILKDVDAAAARESFITNEQLIYLAQRFTSAVLFSNLPDRTTQLPEPNTNSEWHYIVVTDENVDPLESALFFPTDHLYINAQVEPTGPCLEPEDNPGSSSFYYFIEEKSICRSNSPRYRDTELRFDGAAILSACSYSQDPTREYLARSPSDAALTRVSECKIGSYTCTTSIDGVPHVDRGVTPLQTYKAIYSSCILDKSTPETSAILENSMFDYWEAEFIAPKPLCKPASCEIVARLRQYTTDFDPKIGAIKGIKALPCPTGFSGSPAGETLYHQFSGIPERFEISSSALCSKVFPKSVRQNLPEGLKLNTVEILKNTKDKEVYVALEGPISRGSLMQAIEAELNTSFNGNTDAIYNGDMSFVGVQFKVVPGSLTPTFDQLDPVRTFNTMSDGMIEFAGQFAAERNFTWHSIVSLDGNRCLGDVVGGNVSAGLEFMKLSKWTGGAIESVCKDNFKVFSDSLGSVVLQKLKSSYRLSDYVAKDLISTLRTSRIVKVLEIETGKEVKSFSFNGSYFSLLDGNEVQPDSALRIYFEASIRQNGF